MGQNSLSMAVSRRSKGETGRLKSNQKSIHEGPRELRGPEKGEISMGLYAIILPPDDLVQMPLPAGPTTEDEVVWEGVESGVFRYVGPIHAQRGAVVEMNTLDANVANQQLANLLFVKEGLVSAELLDPGGQDLDGQSPTSSNGSRTPARSDGRAA